MTNRVVTKVLAGLQDLLLGTGTEVQVRASGDVTVNKIDAAGLPYENAESIRTKLGKKIEVLTNVAAMQVLVTATVEEKFVYLLGYITAGDGGGGLFYLDTTDTTSAEDLQLIFNPDTPASGRWKRVDTTGYLSPDNGDADLTINDYDEGIQLFATPLTANRIITLPISGLFKGKKVRVTRLDTAFFTLDIGGIRTIPSGESATVELTYNGASWVLTLYSIIQAGATAASTSLAQALTLVVKPTFANGHKDFYTQNVVPAFFNNEWGGANWGNLPDGSFGEVATGFIGAAYVEQENLYDVAGRTFVSTSFKVSKNLDVAAIWLHLLVVGVPTNDLEVFIYSDSAGSPGALIPNGTADTISGKLLNGDLGGSFKRFDFAVSPSLLADTVYHIVATSSGAVDNSNYFVVTFTEGYPFGTKNAGDAVPAWTPSVGESLNFLVEPVVSDQVLQTGGVFSTGKYACFEGSPINQSGALRKENKYFLNHIEGTLHFTGSDFTSGKTFLDCAESINRNRLVLNCTSGNVPQVTLYEADRTVHTVTGNTNITIGDFSIDIGYRAKGDGLDYLKLFVNGVEEGVSIINQSFTLDKSLVLNGTTIIGGGYPLAPVMSHTLDMSVLPSIAGWAWTGTATEVDVMTINDNILYQNGAGYGSTENGYYQKGTALSNTTGWFVEFEVDLDFLKSATSSAILVTIRDGVKELSLSIFDSSIESQPCNCLGRHTYQVLGKGSDYFLFQDYKLIIEGTGKLVSLTALNEILFGDTQTSAGVNGSAKWHYLHYFNTNILLEFSSCELSELAYWTNDKLNLSSTIYNNGQPYSVVKISNLPYNYTQKALVQTEAKTVQDLSILSADLIPIGIKVFSLGSLITVDSLMSGNNSNAGESITVAVSFNTGKATEYILESPTALYNSYITTKTVFNSIQGLNSIQLLAKESASVGLIRNNEFNVTGESW